MRPITILEIAGAWRCLLEERHLNLYIKQNEWSIFTEVVSYNWMVQFEVSGNLVIERNEETEENFLVFNPEFKIQIIQLLNENSIVLDVPDLGSRLEFNRLNQKIQNGN